MLCVIPIDSPISPMIQDKQEQRRKTVKQHVADKNMEYINYRTRDFIKVIRGEWRDDLY